jgi:hypothetical protein
MDGSELLTVGLRLNINTKADVARSWTMSIKLHDWMIDCVDYEEKYRLQSGGNGSGWHRHQWDADEESAKRGKLPAPELEGTETHDEFLIRGLGVFNVRVNAVSHGEPELQFS